MDKLQMKGTEIIKGYDNFYCIYPDGTVISPSYTDKRGCLRKMKILKPQLRGKGYESVGLMKKGKQTWVSVHRLVAKTFIENPNNKPQVNHIDGNKLNNHFSNLEWTTCQENIQHSYDSGIRVGTNHFGERNNKAVLDEQKVLEILNSNKSVKELADKFHVSFSAIYKIKERKRWSHL